MSLSKMFLAFLTITGLALFPVAYQVYLGQPFTPVHSTALFFCIAGLWCNGVLTRERLIDTSEVWMVYTVLMFTTLHSFASFRSMGYLIVTTLIISTYITYGLSLTTSLHDLEVQYGLRKQ